MSAIVLAHLHQTIIGPHPQLDDLQAADIRVARNDGEAGQAVDALTVGDVG